MAMIRTGDWQRVANIVANLNREAVAAYKESLMKFGLKVEALAKKHIASQDLNWQTLKPLTVARKVRKGQSEKILIATSTYFQSISSWVEGDTVYAGVKKTAYAADGITELADIAAVLEFGSQNGAIPARPLWQPTFDEAIKWHKANNRPQDIFLRRLRRY